MPPINRIGVYKKTTPFGEEIVEAMLSMSGSTPDIGANETLAICYKVGDTFSMLWPYITGSSGNTLERDLRWYENTGFEFQTDATEDVLRVLMYQTPHFGVTIRTFIDNRIRMGFQESFPGVMPLFDAVGRLATNAGPLRDSGFDLSTSVFQQYALSGVFHEYASLTNLGFQPGTLQFMAYQRGGPNLMGRMIAMNQQGRVGSGQKSIDFT